MVVFATVSLTSPSLLTFDKERTEGNVEIIDSEHPEIDYDKVQLFEWGSQTCG